METMVGLVEPLDPLELELQEPEVMESVGLLELVVVVLRVGPESPPRSPLSAL